MRRHSLGQVIEGVDRHQAMLLPECLEDYIVEDRPVRAIYAFIDLLDLAGLSTLAAIAQNFRNLAKLRPRIVRTKIAI
ncbi:MAG: hypothetical protein AAF636_12675 [Pseudomonadota bacterium]